MQSEKDSKRRNSRIIAVLALFAATPLLFCAGLYIALVAICTEEHGSAHYPNRVWLRGSRGQYQILDIDDPLNSCVEIRLKDEGIVRSSEITEEWATDHLELSQHNRTGSELRFYQTKRSPDESGMSVGFKNGKLFSVSVGTGIPFRFCGGKKFLTLPATPGQTFRVLGRPESQMSHRSTQSIH